MDKKGIILVSLGQFEDENHQGSEQIQSFWNKKILK